MNSFQFKDKGIYTNADFPDLPPYEQTVVVYLDDVIYEQPPIESLSMLFYHPALLLPNRNTQYFENLVHSQSLLDRMTLMQMVLDSYLVQFDIMCIRYAYDTIAVSVYVLQKIQPNIQQYYYDLPQEPLTV